MMARFIPMFAVLAICDSVLAENDRDTRNFNPFTAITNMASDAIDSVGLSAVNPIKISGDIAGATFGTMGLVWGKQENKKCYYQWGLGFSGPGSFNPERWNGEKWDDEDTGGLLHLAGNLAAAGNGFLFENFASKEVRVQGCKMLGMGYETQQPGFPSKPGTCPQGPDCHGPPGVSTFHYTPGQAIPEMPPGTTVIYTIPGRPGQVPPGTPGSVMTFTTPGQPGYTTTTQGQPRYTTTTQGQPGYTTTTQGQHGYTITTPGQPGYTTTTQGQPGYTITTPGQPGYTTTTQGQPGYTTTTQGQPGYTITTPVHPGYTTITTPGQPPQCQCPCRG